MVKIARKDPYSSTKVIACNLVEKTGVDINERTVRRELYERLPPNKKFSLKEHNTSCLDMNLPGILDMQMAYLEGLDAAIASGSLSIEDMYFEDECPLYKGKLPRYGCKQGASPLFGRIPYK